MTQQRPLEFSALDDGSAFDDLREAIGDLYGCSDVAFKISAKIAFDEAIARVARIEHDVSARNE